MHHLLRTSRHLGGSPVSTHPSSSCKSSIALSIAGVTIMNQPDIFPIPNDCKLNPFQELVPTVFVLTLNKSKSNRKQLIISIHSNICQHLQSILSCEKGSIDA
jgi:hypothetical protein